MDDETLHALRSEVDRLKAELRASREIQAAEKQILIAEIAKNAERAAREKWRPIATAPFNCPILVRNPYAVAHRWSVTREWFTDTAHGPVPIEPPAEWLPIPGHEYPTAVQPRSAPSQEPQLTPEERREPALPASEVAGE